MTDQNPSLISRDDRYRLQQIDRWVRNLRGPGVINSPNGATVNPIRQRRRPGKKRRSPWFDAIVTGNAAMDGADYRWQYAWSEVYHDGTGMAVLEPADGGRYGTTTVDFALNYLEMYHTSTYAWGVDVTGTDYPSSFAPRPVGGAGTDDDHKYNVPVRMRQVKGEGGIVYYRFRLMWGHDGECESS